MGNKILKKKLIKNYLFVDSQLYTFYIINPLILRTKLTHKTHTQPHRNKKREAPFFADEFFFFGLLF